MDTSLLTAALVGYEFQLQKIKIAITEIRGQLHPAGTPSDVPDTTGARPKRQMSAAARKRIAAGQKKRWAAFHTSSETPITKAAPKRKLSPERRAALAANLAKARQARATKRAAA